MNEELQPAPWYKQFWPWFLIALLGYSVIQGLTLLTVATRNPPGLISDDYYDVCLLYTSPSPRDLSTSRMPSSA